MYAEFAPDFRTPEERLSREDRAKRQARNTFEGELNAELKNEMPDLSWEAELIAKSHGIYLEYNRANRKGKKDWIYMVRITIPGGGPISPQQWEVLDDLSEKYGKDPQGKASLRITTRQNIQFHWVRKDGVLDIVRSLASLRMKTLNGAGDNARNITACPLSGYSDIFNANAWAHLAADYFQLPLDPYVRVFELDPDAFEKPSRSFQYGPALLSRKLKMGFSTVHRDRKTGEIVPDNCTEFLTNDIGISPIVVNGQVRKFQIYIGGGQGQRNGKLTAAMLARPLGIVSESELMETLGAIVAVYQEWGDRSNRHWARLKYIVHEMGIDWFCGQLHKRLGFEPAQPDPFHNYGQHCMHYGWTAIPGTELGAYTLFIENGRIRDDTRNGNIKSMMRELIHKYQPEIVLSPDQNALCILPIEQKEEFEKDLKHWRYGERRGKPVSPLRMHSGACVGLDTCRLAYTDSERLEPALIDELESKGWGELATTIGISGCERQCCRPSTKAIGLIGSGINTYQLRLMGTEDGRHQGQPLTSEDEQCVFLRHVPRARIASLIDVLFSFYIRNRRKDETLGYFHRRVGVKSLLDYLACHPSTADLLQQSSPAHDSLGDGPYGQGREMRRLLRAGAGDIDTDDTGIHNFSSQSCSKIPFEIQGSRHNAFDQKQE